MQKKTPITAITKGKGLFERFGGAVVESNRWFTAFIVMCFVCLVQLYSFNSMLPLKTVVPYLIQVKDTGQIAAKPIEAANFTPDENAKRYFLTQWVTKLFTLDRFLTEQYLVDAYSVCRTEAAEEFRSYINENQPIVALRSDPNLVQNITIRSVSFLQDGGALIRVRVLRRNAQGLKTSDKLITVHFSIIPPKTEQEIYTNPIGLYITHFAVGEDIS